MILAAAAALLLAASPGPSADPGQALGARIRDAAVAAQGLQGDLDGAWIVRDQAGRALYRLEIADPPGGAGPLQAAWAASTGAALGPVATIVRSGDRLTLVFAPALGEVMLRLRKTDGRWRGWAALNGARRPIRMMRA